MFFSLLLYIALNVFFLNQNNSNNSSNLTELLEDGEASVKASDVFGFRTPRKKGSMLEKAESTKKLLQTPTTPKTPRSALKQGSRTPRTPKTPLSASKRMFGSSCCFQLLWYSYVAVSGSYGIYMSFNTCDIQFDFSEFKKKYLFVIFHRISGC